MLVTRPITVALYDIFVKDTIGTSNGQRSLAPCALLRKTHVYAVTRKTRAIFWYIILEKHVIGLGNSLGVNIGRLSKDGNVF